MSGCHAAYTQC